MGMTRGHALHRRLRPRSTGEACTTGFGAPASRPTNAAGSGRSLDLITGAESHHARPPARWVNHRCGPWEPDAAALDRRRRRS